MLLKKYDYCFITLSWNYRHTVMKCKNRSITNFQTSCTIKIQGFFFKALWSLSNSFSFKYKIREELRRLILYFCDYSSRHANYVGESKSLKKGPHNTWAYSLWLENKFLWKELLIRWFWYFRWSYFNYLELNFQESIIIKKFEPSLNKHVCSVLLCSFN